MCSSDQQTLDKKKSSPESVQVTSLARELEDQALRPLANRSLVYKNQIIILGDNPVTTEISVIYIKSQSGVASAIINPGRPQTVKKPATCQLQGKRE